MRESTHIAYDDFDLGADTSVEVRITYRVTPGRAAVLAPNDRAHPEEPPEVYVDEIETKLRGAPWRKAGPEVEAAYEDVTLEWLAAHTADMGATA